MRLQRAVVLIVGIPLLLFGVLGPASGAVLAESTFEVDIDGWTAIGFQGLTIVPLPVTFAAGAGSPGGALHHEAPSGIGTSFFIAPAKFPTALHSAIGGSIQWDIAAQHTPIDAFFAITDIAVATGPSLLLASAAIFTEVTPPAPPDAPVFAEYELNFLVGNGWRFADGPFRGNAPLATQAEIDAVLASATFLLIRAEYFEGPPAPAPTPPDLTFLDNVRVLNAAAPVPVPATLLLLVVGGSAALALKSQAGRRKSFKEIKFYKRRKRWAF